MEQSKIKIKIIVATHKDYWTMEDPVYLPLHVGAAGKEDFGFRRDDTGENISIKNPNYCELTALYWAWKNLDADFLGLVHYRRYFTRKEVHGSYAKRKEILTEEEWKKILSDYSVVVADRRKYYIETNRSHYNHAHYREGLDVAEQVIKEKFPEYSEAFAKVMNRTWAHMFNMFVMRRDLFDQYMSWLFSVLDDVEKRVEINEWNEYESRIYGFVAELMLDVWLEKNKFIYKEQNVSFMERQNWIKKGGLFIKRKFFGH